MCTCNCVKYMLSLFIFLFLNMVYELIRLIFLGTINLYATDVLLVSELKCGILVKTIST